MLINERKLHQVLDPVLENPGIKKWNIFKLEAPLQTELFGGDEPRREIREPNEFRQALKLGLKPMFKCVVYTHFHDGALWAAIDLLSIGLVQAKSTLFLCHYPHAEFVFMSAFKNKAIFRFLQVGICQAFDCRELVQVDCKGNSLHNLADLALFPLSHGAFGAYRLYKSLLDSNALQPNSLEDHQRRNRLQHRQETRVNTEGVVLEYQSIQKSTTGALDSKQAGQQTKATEAMREIKLVMDLDLNVTSTKQIPFECKLVIKGFGLMNTIGKLTGMRLVTGEDASEHIADASNVISGALNHRKRAKDHQRPAPTSQPTLVPTNEPTVEPAATVAPTNEPTTMPTLGPIQSPVEPPTVPANPICLPVIGMDKTECATLIKTCSKSNVTMFWAGAGCRVNGMVQNDGGCQCKDYCGYTCSKACTVTATGKAYVPRDSKYCPTN
ncbi:hypothetical protein BASA81_002158 [Batrachochytrium salamandrivorans]|nr:hypothetical protein BASA81_002158 [Batrachochytrium salamandrivorans]